MESQRKIKLKLVSVLYLFSFLIIGCSSNEDKRLTDTHEVLIDESGLSQLREVSNQWKEDSIGCTGKRYTILKSIGINAFKVLENRASSFALQMLGEPDTLFLRGNRKSWIYYLECPFIEGFGSKSNVDRRTDISILVLEERKDELIENARIMVP